MSPDTPPLLAFDGVGKRYGRQDVLRDVALEIRAGEYVAITGPSGSGKSTLLNLATLLDRPTSGTIRFDGRRASALSDGDLSSLRGGHVGVVYQNFHMLKRRTALENVMFRFRYAGDRAVARAQALAALGFVGLADWADRPAHLLSGGEMQRVAIARAIALPPRLLAADEPTGNLDAANAAIVIGLFRQLHLRGTTILLVTHNQALTRDCTRHLACRDGRVASGP